MLEEEVLCQNTFSLEVNINIIQGASTGDSNNQETLPPVNLSFTVGDLFHTPILSVIFQHLRYMKFISQASWNSCNLIMWHSDER